jgi:hypothetical protein
MFVALLWCDVCSVGILVMWGSLENYSQLQIAVHQAVAVSTNRAM